MIYADTNILVYLVEDETERGDEVRRRFADLSGQIAISPLVDLECKVGPFRSGDALLANRYDRLFDQLTVLDIEPGVYREAASLRARHGLSTIDAIHLATAQFHLCGAFWTNDARLTKAAGGLLIELV